MPIRKLDISHLDTSGAQYGANLTYVASNARFEWVLGTYVSAVSFNWTNTPTESILRASDAQAEDYFGYSVSINGDGTYAIVGAWGEDGGAGDPLSVAGAVYVFTRSGSTWTEQAILRASDAQAGDLVGQTVSISSDGTYALVSATGEDGGSGDPISGAGAAYVFSRSGSTWTQQAKLTASDAQASDQFGYSLSISSDGSYAIVSTRNEDGGAGDPLANAGAAYVFSRSGSTWTQQAILRASDAQAQDQFGYSVSINEDGTYAIVGAAYEDGGSGDPLSDAGAAYIFTRSGSTWTQQAKITASDLQAGDQFGWSVSINDDGDYVIVGARNEDGGAGDPISNAGAAYVFTRSGSTWTQQAKITASDAQADDYFGIGVAINSDATYAIVGTPTEDGGAGDPISGAGAAYVFERSGSTWTEAKKLTASDAQANDYFGQYGVSISGDGAYASAGAWFEDGGAGDPISGAGAAYIYEAG